jgi:hypothetical protein
VELIGQRRIVGEARNVKHWDSQREAGAPTASWPAPTTPPGLYAEAIVGDWTQAGPPAMRAAHPLALIGIPALLWLLLATTCTPVVRFVSSPYSVGDLSKQGPAKAINGSVLSEHPVAAVGAGARRRHEKREWGGYESEEIKEPFHRGTLSGPAGSQAAGKVG